MISKGCWQYTLENELRTPETDVPDVGFHHLYNPCCAMKTHKFMLLAGICGGLLMLVTACEPAPIEPAKPKAAPVLPNAIYADDPPVTPIRPPGA